MRRYHLLWLIPVISGGLTGQSFTPTGSMHEARWQHTATLLNNGTVLVTGGYTGSTVSSTAEIYDPQTGTWRYTNHGMNGARQTHTATKLLDGRVLIAGGLSAMGNVNTAEIFDPGTEHFTPVASMNEIHPTGQSVLLADGTVIVLTGSDRNAIYTGPNGSEIYDPVANSWTVVPSALVGYAGFTSTLLPSGKILVAGGYDGYVPAVDNTVSLYDGIAHSQQALAALIVSRAGHTATLLPDGMVLMAGGTTASYSTASTEIYDPTVLPNGSTSLSTYLNQNRREHTATLLANGDVLAAGGFQAAQGQAIAAYLSTVELRDHVTGTWSLVGSMSIPRQSHTATLLPSGSVLVAGGGATSPSNTTELWAGAVSTGTIQVTTNLSSATFTITGQVSYQGSGTSFNQPNAPAGSYKITFGAVAGCTTPASQTMTLSPGGTIAFSGIYQGKGTLSVTTNNPGAMFTITGPATHNGHGESMTFPNSPTGTYTITFGAIPKYITPLPQTGTLNPDQTFAFSEGIYTPITIGACPANSIRCAPTMTFTYQQGSGGSVLPQEVQVTSNGPAIPFKAATSTSPPGGKWLSVAPPSAGTTPATFAVAVSGNQVTGTYTGNISVTSADATNVPMPIVVTLTVTPPPPPAFSVSFPVVNDVACTGPEHTCTANTAPINSIFDHWMTFAYEDVCAGKEQPADYGTIMDFRNELANQNPQSLTGMAIPPKERPATGGGECAHDYGYQGSGPAFLAESDYPVNYRNGQTLFYDAHPGYDYNFVFHTPVAAAVSGCVDYEIPLDYGKPPAITLVPPHYHILTIVPVNTDPGDCATFTAKFLKTGPGYVVNYLHLSSYIDHGSVLVSTNTDGSMPRPCSVAEGCAQPNKWVSAGTPVGFSGNFANNKWGGVRPHLHFEVDWIQSGAFIPVDPYGWHPKNDPSAVDPYTARHPGVPNVTLWSDFKN